MPEVRSTRYAARLLNIRHIFRRQLLRPKCAYLKRESVRQSVSAQII